MLRINVVSQGEYAFSGYIYKRIVEILLLLFIFMSIDLFPKGAKCLAQVPIDPSHVGIQNAKLGTRLNFDFQFSNAAYSNRQSAGVYTGVLGTEADNLDQFVLATFLDADSSVQSFHIGENPYYSYSNVQLRLGLTRMTLEGIQQNRIRVRFIQMNPFTSTDSLNQFDNLINITPFFIQELQIENLSDTVQSGYVLISHSDAFAVNSDSLVNHPILLLNGNNDQNGWRAFCAVDTLHLMRYEIGPALFDHFNSTGRLQNTIANEKSQGGFSWHFHLNAGQKKTWRFIYAGYYNGTVMHDTRFEPAKPLYFAYLKYFHSIFDVLKWTIENVTKILEKNGQFEEKLRNALLSETQKYTVASAFHSYFPNTFLLSGENDNDWRYYVWEGQIKYISTLDVAYETGLFEGLVIPWALRMQLQEWGEIVQTDAEGVYYPHDLGYKYDVTPQQAYAYLGGNMGVEENCNYMLLLYWYWKQTGDTAFILSKKDDINRIFLSLQNRDSNGNGLADRDAYFTTIDQKEAVHCAAENSYIAVKELASFLSGAEIFEALGDSARADSLKRYADQTMQTLMVSPDSAGNANGRMPTIHYYGENLNLSDVWNFYEQNDYCGPFPNNWNAATMVIPEGLLYLLLTNYDFSSKTAFIQKLMRSNKAHFDICHSGAVFTSLTSELTRTWFSKLFDNELINQVLSNLFPHYAHYPLNALEEAFPLLSQKGNRGYSDSWQYSDGQRRGLDFYPRGVNAFGFLVFNHFHRLIAPIPIRINCGGDTIEGWHADAYLFGKRGTYHTSDSIRCAYGLPMRMWQTESYGPDGTGYEIPVENGLYKVTFYFDEIYHKSNKHVGTRIFDVMIEDSIYISHLNIFDQVGADSCLRKGPFEVDVHDGYITILGVHHQGTDINNKFGGIKIEYADRPNIFDINVKNIDFQNATIEWNTDVPTQGRVDYGLSDSLNSHSSVDSIFASHHEVQIDSLQSNTQYFFHVVSWDSTHVVSQSDIHTFSTPLDTSALPVPIAFFSLKLLSDTEVILSWRLESEEALYGIEIQRSDNNKKFAKIGMIRLKKQNAPPYTFNYKDTISFGKIVRYRLKLIEMDGQVQFSKILRMDSFLPKEFTLYPNYPNPFNESTMIRFFVPKRFSGRSVTIMIYNIRGEMVWQRKSKSVRSGVHQCLWDGTDRHGNYLSSGLFFCKIHIGNINKILKMTLLK